MNRAYITIILILITPHAIGGGTSWLVNVKSFEGISKTSAFIELEFLENWDYVKTTCTTAKISINYEPSHFGSLLVKKTLTLDAHKDALNTLKTAFETKKSIRFGIMGSGLKQVGVKGNCNFESKGVSKLQEYRGNKEVYSFHGP